MKKFYGIFFALLLIAVLTSCNKNTANGTEEPSKSNESVNSSETSDMSSTSESLETSSTSESSSVHIHSWGEWTILTQATATEDGKRERGCVCGEKETEKIPATGSIGLAYTVNADGKTCIVTGVGTCGDEEILIPASIDGYTVKAIGEKAFFACVELKSIRFSPEITQIGENAFAGCTGLKTLMLSEKLEKIGAHAGSKDHKS